MCVWLDVWMVKDTEQLENWRERATNNFRPTLNVFFVLYT